MLRFGHSGGLCNRIDVMTTGLLFAQGNGGDKVELHWPLNSDLPAHFSDLFTELPGGSVVERDLEPSVLAAYASIAAAMPVDYRTTAGYSRILRRVLGCIVEEVGSEVSRFTAAHFDPNRELVGVHVRRCEGTLISPYAQPLRYYEAVMRSYPDQTRFFVSTDSQEAFQWLRVHFGDRVFQKEKRLNNRTEIGGIREGLVDMLLLSQCDSIIGTFGSSFSAIAGLFGGRPVLMVKAVPRIPKDWLHFSPTRWVYSYRHLLVESTFWRTTWRYQILRGSLVGSLRKSKRQLFSLFVPNSTAHP